MGNYSTDSDSSSVRSRKKHSKRRSRSSGRSSSHRSKHSSSRHSERSPSSRYRSRHSRRSSSRDRKRRSRSHSRRTRRSRSRDSYRKRSGSRDAKRSHHKSKHSRHRNRSSSRGRLRSTSSSSDVSTRKHSPNPQTDSSEKALRDKLLQTIQEAQRADNRNNEQSLFDIKPRNELDLLPPIKPDPDAIKEIEEDCFAPKTFKSSKVKVEDIKLPISEKKIIIPEKTVFHTSFFEDPQAKMDRWVKKLFQIRQRALSSNSPK